MIIPWCGECPAVTDLAKKSRHSNTYAQPVHLNLRRSDVSGGSSWRSPNAAERYAHHDYADFAQEFLQRNSDYLRDHAETKHRIAKDPACAQAEEEGLAGRWGLSFPHPARRRSADPTGALVAARSARRRRGKDRRHSGDPAAARR
ncbi:transcriptional regulator domain-containing protein [Sphingobium arseniciresistens]|uniref:transcriptional regulator domain-containing protein n=1 Tax=Sphingobium arseniciresistens TaxID=3030834 RepID=UPI003BAFB17D